MKLEPGGVLPVLIVVAAIIAAAQYLGLGDAGQERAARWQVQHAFALPAPQPPNTTSNTSR